MGSYLQSFQRWVESFEIQIVCGHCLCMCVCSCARVCVFVCACSCVCSAQASIIGRTGILGREPSAIIWYHHTRIHTDSHTYPYTLSHTNHPSHFLNLPLLSHSSSALPSHSPLPEKRARDVPIKREQAHGHIILQTRPTRRIY